MDKFKRDELLGLNFRNMHPCCGGSLQDGTKIVGIADIFVNILSLIALIILLVIGVGAYKQPNATTASSSRTSLNDQSGGNINVQLGDEHKAEADVYAVGLALLIIYSIMIILSIIGLLMAIFLLKGAKERNIWKCKAWLIWTAVWWVLSIILVFFGYYQGIFGLVLNAYFMWVVYAFMKEIEMEGGPEPGVAYYSEPGTTPPPKVEYIGTFADVMS